MVRLINYYAGYKEYKTHRNYLNWMGDWRKNKDKEVPLDGIGGVNILVRAEVHRSGTHLLIPNIPLLPLNNHLRQGPRLQVSTFHATPLKTKPTQKDSLQWRNELGIKSSVCRIMWFGILILKRRRGI